jgi:hypothetical protein
MSDSSDSEFNDLAVAIKSFDSDKEGDSSENEVEEPIVESESEEEDKKPVKKQRRRYVDPEEQKALDKFLFGDKEGLLRNLEGNKLFFTDTVGDAEGSQKRNECVWHDSDDEDFKKSTENGEIRNKRKFERIAGAPNWARLPAMKITTFLKPSVT